MVRDDPGMTCEDVNKELKPFMEDLLAEDKYRPFVAHLENCAKCKGYVSALGSVSNQVWELGEVEVPADLGSTVIFKLKQPAEEEDAPQLKKSNKALMIFIVLILTGAALFFGIKYFKKSSSLPEKKEPQISAEGKAAIAGALDELSKPEKSRTLVFETVVTPEGEVEGSTADYIEQEKAEAHAAKAKPLHWHFLYSTESEKIKLSDMLLLLGIATDREFSDLILFRATGLKIKNLLEQGLFTSPAAATLNNFTSDEITFTKTESHVSLYLEKRMEEPGPLHWHLHPDEIERPGIIDMIERIGGTIEYQSDAVIVASIPRREVKNVSEEIRAMGSFSREFGNAELATGEASADPIEISIYFLNK
ncbi:MAG: hypothetical protein ABID09_07390 [Candidatus Omnitrophota bacterium]